MIAEEIPLVGRITSIADIFDALTSERTYKKAWSVDDALELIEKEASQALDPALVLLFLAMLPEVEEIMRTFADETTPT